MDEFKKTIKLEFKADDASVAQINKAFEDLSEKTSEKFKKLIEYSSEIAKNLNITSVIDTSEISSLLKNIEKLQLNKKKAEVTEDRAKAQREAGNIEDAEELEKSLDEIELESAQIAQNIAIDFLKKFSELVLDGLKKVYSESVEDLNEILSYSYLTDSSKREQALTYGFSSAENYAFDQAKELVGISSLDDLFYADQRQREKFFEKFEEYQNRYNELYDSGFFDEYQEFQWEMEEFKEDITYEFLSWAMENKDTIKTVLNSVVEISKFLVDSLGWIINYFGGKSNQRSESEITAKTLDIINNYSQTSTNVSSNITNNIMSKSDPNSLVEILNKQYAQTLSAFGG